MSLLEELRVQIRDTGYVNTAFTLSVAGKPNVRASAEVNKYGRLVVTALEGAVFSLDIDLNLPMYNTIGLLTSELQRIDNYIVSVSPEADLTHSSVDIEPFGPVQIGPNKVGATFNTRLFSDKELWDIIRFATKRHNPSFEPENIPQAEEHLVLSLAKVDVLRRQAMEASKRRGLSLVVADLLSIADSTENTYYLDVSRLRKALYSPPEAPVNEMGEGDVVSGTLMARNWRTGSFAPRSQNLKPAAPRLLDVEDSDVEDTNVRVRWARNRDMDFWSYELWLDYEPYVSRDKTYVARWMADRAPLAVYERSTTSKLVYVSNKANSTAFNVYPTIVDGSDQSVTSFVVSELEPESDYYFRLYVTDRQNEAVGSEVIHIRTKPLRTILRALHTRKATTGSTVMFSTMGAQLTVDNQLYVGNKHVQFTVVGQTSGSFVVPQFTNYRTTKDVSIQSLSGLKSVLPNYLLVTP